MARVSFVLLVLLGIVAYVAAQNFVVNDMNIDSWNLVVAGKFDHINENNSPPPATQPEFNNIASYGYSSFFNYGNWTALQTGLSGYQYISSVAAALNGANKLVFAAGPTGSANGTLPGFPYSMSAFKTQYSSDNWGMELYQGTWTNNVVYTDAPIMSLFTTPNFTVNPINNQSSSDYLLYVGGSFSSLSTSSGVQTVGSLARYDSANNVWSDMLGGVSFAGSVARVYDIVQAPTNGSVIVVGSFSMAGSVVANNIAHYFCDEKDQCTWKAIDNNVVGTVYSARVVIDGNNTYLYIGGVFTINGVVNATNAAVYNFTAGVWMPLMNGVSGSVYTVETDENCVFFGGNFVVENAMTTEDGDVGNATNIACWGFDEQAWIALGDGVDGPVKKLRVGRIFSGPEIVFEKRLFVAGNFSMAGDISSPGLAYYVDRGYGPFNGAWVYVRTGTAINLYAFIVLGVITVISTIFGVVYCIWSYKKKRDATYEPIA